MTEAAQEFQQQLHFKHTGFFDWDVEALCYCFSVQFVLLVKLFLFINYLLSIFETSSLMSHSNEQLFPSKMNFVFN